MICHSYIDLSLISGPPGKGIMVRVCIVFSLEMLFKRENKVNKKAMGAWRGASIVATHISFLHIIK